MAWISLIIAGLLETAWASGMKAAAKEPSAGLIAAVVVTMGLSLGALWWSMTRLPLGVAYPIWTGIGSVGAVAAGWMFFGQSVGWPSFVGVALILAGMAFLSMEG